VSDLEESFAQLLGREATDKERQDLYRVRDALKIKATDTVWLLLMALQHYETLYEKVPARIADEVERVTKTARRTAEAQARAAQEETKKALMGAVEQAAIASRKDGARAELVKRAGWLGGGVVAGALAVFVVGLRIGGAKGEATARDLTRQECGYMATAASWANTPEGRVAFEFAKTGSLRELATCSGPGWEIKGDQCIVRPQHGAIYGWTLSGGGQRKR
jgi:uncharacterized membrane protein YccC